LGVTGCEEATATFSATFCDRNEADRATLERLTEWTERLCQRGVVELKASRSKGGELMSLGLRPPRQKTLLFYIANHESGKPHVYIYSQSYASLGRQAFLSERLGGSPEAEVALKRCEELASGKSLYTTEFSRDTLEALEDLLRIAAEASPAGHKDRPRPTMRTPYTPARREAIGRERAPFEVDPNEIDRATARHMELQDMLAEFVSGKRLQPLKRGDYDPDFDVAWWDEDIAVIAEVKTTTRQNESRQLRLGLGQILDYRDLLCVHDYSAVRAVLVIENKPSDERWTRLCGEHGVELIWPEMFSGLFE
jgi:hypothetical protein